jgi:hypothetical protein
MDAGGANVLYGSSSGLQASRPFRALTLTTNEHPADRLVQGIPNPSERSWTSSTPRENPAVLRRLQVLSAAFISSSSKAHHGGAFGDDWVPIM